MFRWKSKAGNGNKEFLLKTGIPYCQDDQMGKLNVPRIDDGSFQMDPREMTQLFLNPTALTLNIGYR